jgi:Carboxypeptidase regulatory-like domain
MIFKPILLALTGLLLFPLILHQQAAAETGVPTAVLRGEVVDPSGAVVPRARIRLIHRRHVLETRSRADGRYSIRTPAPRSYTVRVTAKGFAPLTIRGVWLSAGHVKDLILPLAVAADYEEVTVVGHVPGVGVGSDQNSGTMVFKGRDLDALSDDPDVLQGELRQLAAAAAGPNGGQIYIDGFAGGRLPPKSSILEIRVNQNPFSAEFNSLGYGRVEIITKPGTEALHGSLSSYGNTSVLNTANPLVSTQPDYHLYSYSGNVSGPIGKHASYFLSAFQRVEQNQNIVDALNPQNTAANTTEAVPNPSNVLIVNPRLDVQIGNHTLTIRDYIYRTTQTGSGVGVLNLPRQAINEDNQENTFQIADTFVVNPRFLNEMHFQWRRVRNKQSASYFTPAVTVSGAFTDGGNISGVVQDHQDIFELQNYSTASAGNHTLRFGARLRAYRDANYSTSGSNGEYTFSSIAAYQASKPEQYSATVISNPLARALLLEGSLFFQDDWRLKPNLMVGLGVRFESQNWIHDHADWAPRLALAWSPGRQGKAAAKTVVRAGYGWFYDRFTVPNTFSSSAGVPFVIQAIHDNRINQQSYVVNNPAFYNPNAPAPASSLISSSSSVPSYHSIDPHFRSALDMQAGVGVDHQVTGKITASVTYLYTQGVHQYLMNNVTAPAFNAANYTVTGAIPTAYNYQFQSGGVFKQNQIIVTSSVQSHNFVLNGSYAFNQAKSDTQGVNSFVSVAQNPGLDYGRASFAVRHRVTLLDSYTAPYGIVFASLLEAQSGTPYNLTIGNDLTGNNQFNARPGYGECGAPGIISTRYGCLDPSPAGKGEQIVPYGAGTGPANILFDLRVSKVFGVGPRIKTASDGSTMESEDSVSSRGLGTGGAAIHLDESTARRYNLTLAVGASNLLNIVNWGTPNGVLISPLFNKTQSLAGGPFANPTPGNRAIIFQSTFSF